MGRGRNRKPRNFATFRLCPRPGAADASDRVFVRVDDNPYSVPGFADDSGGPSSSATTGGGDDEPSDGAALPEDARREILELGLPDDGYDYLAHLRELRPSLASTGGGASAVFLPSRRPARSGLPVDVKAYDLSRVPIGSGEVAETAADSRRVEEAIDFDVAKLLEGSDLPAAGSGDEDLEEDFVVIANQPDEDEEDCRGREGAQRLSHEHFDSLASEEYADGEDDCCVQDAEHESQEVIVEQKLPHSEAPQYFTHRTLESIIEEQIGGSSNAFAECAGYAERYSDEGREEELGVLVPESSDGSAVRYFGKEKLLKFPPGETSMKKAIIKKGIEKLPAEYLPQRRNSSGGTLIKGEPKDETK